MNIAYDFYVDGSNNIVIEFSDLESRCETGAKISHEEIEFLKDNQYDIYREISYCTFKALLLLVRRINDIKGANKMNYYKKGCEPENKRYIHIAKDDSDIYQDTKANEILSDYVILERLNEQEEEIQVLKRHIKRNTISRITVEDALGCARDARFYDNEEIVKAIDCIAKDLGINLD